MSFKEYIFSLRRFILVAFLVFVFGVFNGYSFAQSSPEEMKLVLEQVQEMFGPILEMPTFGQFLIILLNNSFTAFLVIVLGIIFGIFPFLTLFSNGLVLGLVVYFAQAGADWSTIFALTLPHAIIEIPAIILACAVGFKLGKAFFDRIFKKQPSTQSWWGVKTELDIALSFFLKVLLPLSVIAAAIEVFITSQLLL